MHEYCYARSNVCCPAYMKKEVQIFPPAPVTTPSSFQTSVSSPLFCLFPVVLADQSIQHAILTQPDRTRFLFKTYMDAHPGPGCQGCQNKTGGHKDQYLFCLFPDVLVVHSTQHAILWVHILEVNFSHRTKINLRHRLFSKICEWAKYRVSHSKVCKVILLWWGYRFGFLLI